MMNLRLRKLLAVLLTLSFVFQVLYLPAPVSAADALKDALVPQTVSGSFIDMENFDPAKFNLPNELADLQPKTTQDLQDLGAMIFASILYLPRQCANQTDQDLFSFSHYLKNVRSMVASIKTDISDAKTMSDIIGKAGGQLLTFVRGEGQRGSARIWRKALNTIRKIEIKHGGLLSKLDDFGKHAKTLVSAAATPKKYGNWLSLFSKVKLLTDSRGSRWMNRSVAGLAVLGTVLDASNVYFGSQELLSDREIMEYGLWDYQKADTFFGVAVSALALLSSLTPMGFITILAITSTITVVRRVIKAMIGARSKYLTAYKASFDFLMENDQTFQNFYQGRGNGQNLCVAWKSLDTSLKGSMSRTKDADARKNLEEVHASLEKQGLLASYYQITPMEVQSINVDQLQGLWEFKADFFNWQRKSPEKVAPAQPSSGGEDDLSPFEEYVLSFRSSINSAKSWEFKWGTKESLEGIPKKWVILNPDYFLYRKFLSHKVPGSLAAYLLPRIQMAPFNYLFLLRENNWSAKLLEQALEIDAFLCSTIEIGSLVDALYHQREENKGMMSALEEQAEAKMKAFSEERITAITEGIDDMKDCLEKIAEMLENPDDEAKKKEAADASTAVEELLKELKIEGEFFYPTNEPQQAWMQEREKAFFTAIFTLFPLYLAQGAYEMQAMQNAILAQNEAMKLCDDLLEDRKEAKQALLGKVSGPIKDYLTGQDQAYLKQKITTWAGGASAEKEYDDALTRLQKEFDVLKENVQGVHIRGRNAMEQFKDRHYELLKGLEEYRSFLEHIEGLPGYDKLAQKAAYSFKSDAPLFNKDLYKVPQP